MGVDNPVYRSVRTQGFSTVWGWVLLTLCIDQDEHKAVVQLWEVGVVNLVYRSGSGAIKVR